MSSTPEKYSAVSRWFGFDTLDPERFVTSYFVSPLTLLCVRSVIALYITWGLIYEIYNNVILGVIQYMFTYFTNLTYVGLWGYYVSSVVHSTLYYIRHDASSFKNSYIASSHWALYHTILVSNVLTPVVFWALLSEPLIKDNSTAQSWYSNVNVHTLTFIWMIIDVFLTRQRITWRMFLFDLLMIILFTFESWVTHAVDNFWVYGFLSWSQGPIAAAYYLGIGVFVVIIFAVQRFIIHPLRDLLGKKYGRYRSQYLEANESVEVEESQESQKEYAVVSFSTDRSGDNVV